MRESRFNLHSSAEHHLSSRLSVFKVASPPCSPFFSPPFLRYHRGDDVRVFGGPDQRLAVARIVVFEPRKVVLRYCRRLYEPTGDVELDGRGLVATNVEHACGYEYLKGKCVVMHSTTFASEADLQQYRRIGGHFLVTEQVQLPIPRPSSLTLLVALEEDFKAYDSVEHILLSTRRTDVGAARTSERGRSLASTTLRRIADCEGSTCSLALAVLRRVLSRQASRLSLRSNSTSRRAAYTSRRLPCRAGTVLTSSCRENHDTTDMHEGDISEVLESFAHQQRYSVPKPKFALPDGPIDVVFGSPLCCSHSKANRKKVQDDPRSFLIFAFLWIIELFKPAYLCVVPSALCHLLKLTSSTALDSVLENVPDMLTAKLPSLEGETELDRGLTQLFVQVALTLGSVLLPLNPLAILRS